MFSTDRGLSSRGAFKSVTGENHEMNRKLHKRERESVGIRRANLFFLLFWKPW